MQMIFAKCGNCCDLCPLYKENFSASDADLINAGHYKYHHAGQGPHPNYAQACDGCLSDGYVARKNCCIRECVTNKAFATCAECDQLFCSLLKADMEVIEGARARYATTMSKEDYEKYFRPFLTRETLLNLRSQKQQSGKLMKD
jgi:Protein of unknown function (DUF3795)